MRKKKKNPNNSKIQTKNLKLSLLTFVFGIVLLLLVFDFSSMKASTTTCDVKVPLIKVLTFRTITRLLWNVGISRKGSSTSKVCVNNTNCYRRFSFKFYKIMMNSTLPHQCHRHLLHVCNYNDEINWWWQANPMSQILSISKFLF